MQVLVTYGGDSIPKSPFTVGVAAPLDLNKIKINGLENSKCRGRGDGLVSKLGCHAFLRGFADLGLKVDHVVKQLSMSVPICTAWMGGGEHLPSWECCENEMS
jgi:hypothetical protein